MRLANWTPALVPILVTAGAALALLYTVEARGPTSPPLIQAAKGRSPTALNPVDQLARESEAPWSIERDRAGWVRRMSGGSLPGSRAPAIAANEFLQKYAESLLGVASADLQQTGMKVSDRVTQVSFEQSHDSRPVLGSRLVLTFDREGSLVHLASALRGGSFPALSAKLSAEAAGRLAKDALARDRSVREATGDAPGLAYVLKGESISLVYRQRVLLGDGAVDVWVDAQSGAATVITQ